MVLDAFAASGLRTKAFTSLQGISLNKNTQRWLKLERKTCEILEPHWKNEVLNDVAPYKIEFLATGDLMKCLQTVTIFTQSSCFIIQKKLIFKKKSYVTYYKRPLPPKKQLSQSDALHIEVRCEVVVFMSSAAHAIYAAVHGLKVVIRWTLRAWKLHPGRLTWNLKNPSNWKGSSSSKPSSFEIFPMGCFQKWMVP